MTDFLTALGLALALEGALYAIAPGAVKDFMRRALQMPDQFIRTAGLAAIAFGVFVVWLVRG